MRIDRVRRREYGSGYAGSYDWSFDDPDLGHSGEYVPWIGQPVFSTSEICADSAFSHYTLLGAERWHDLWIDKFDLEAIPVIRGSGNLPAPYDAYSYQFYDRVWSGPDPISENDDEREARVGFIPDTGPVGVFPTKVGPIPTEFDLTTVKENQLDSPPFSHLDLSTQFSPYTTLLSRVNPLKSKVDVSNGIEALKDAPRLLFIGGKSLIGAVGSANLQLQFGWKPLLHDINNLFKLGSHLATRLRQIKALENGGLSTHSLLEEASDADEGTGEFQESNLVSLPLISYTWKRHTTMKRWGAVNWAAPELLSRDASLLDDDVRRWEAIRTLYGLHWRNPAGLWELLPWSWLIDWFVPIQQMLDRYSNLYTLEPREVGIMTQTITKFIIKVDSMSGYSPFYLSTPELKGTRVTKERVISDDPSHFPTLKPGRPIWSNSRLGILLSLIGQRR